MSIVNNNWDYARQGKSKPGFHVDFSFLRHFVGIFAVGFSALVWYGVLHFVFHIV